MIYIYIALGVAAFLAFICLADWFVEWLQMQSFRTGILVCWALFTAIGIGLTYALR